MGDIPQRVRGRRHGNHTANQQPEATRGGEAEGGSGINSLWLAHLPRGIRPGLPRLSSVNEPAEWTDPSAEICMRVALHFIKARKGKRPRMEKEILGGGGGEGRKDPTVVHVGPITSRPHEIHRPSSLTKDARASTEHNKFQCFPLPSLSSLS